MIFYLLMFTAIEGEGMRPVLGDDIRSAMSLEFCTEIAEEWNADPSNEGVFFSCVPLEEE